MSSEVVISLRDAGKCYRVYDRPQDRLKESVVGGLYRLIIPVVRLTGYSPARPVYSREFWALRDINLEISRGETLGIVGLNGSGKSTLLQIIAGTLNPTMGNVTVKGRVAALLELGSGFNPEFTGRENVFLNGTILGLTHNEVSSRFDKIAEFADIGQFIDQPVKTYSSGMALRLAFAVIAHVDADILIIDEALSVGDVVFTQKCMRFLRNFQKHGTIVFVSHDTGAVVNLCTRALWLKDGSVRMVSDAKSVSEAYLEAFYERLQGPLSADTKPARTEKKDSQPIVDQRLQFINKSNARNDIELFSFHPQAASFGKGGAQIIDVALMSDREHRLSWVVGGEYVVLRVRAKVFRDLERPIVGFFVKDRLGQCLFGDNTFLTYRDQKIQLETGEILEATFAFAMPILPTGHYSISVAVAEGTQSDHTQHHWIHDAVQFQSHSTSVSTGLVGVPMAEINLKRIGAS